MCHRNFASIQVARSMEEQRPADAIRILILDGHVTSAHGLAAILKGQRQFEVVGIASALQDALDLEPEAHIVVVDFVALDEGVTAIRKLLEAYPGTRVAVLSASENPQDVYEAMDMGVRGYLSKRVSVDILLNTLTLIHEDEVVVGPHVVATLLHRSASKPLHLSKAESDMMELVAQGADTGEIARRMALSESTVKRRLAEIQRRLEARNRIEAAIRAARLGLI